MTISNDVEFRNDRGEKLVGVVTDSYSELQSPRQAVVLCHGLLLHHQWRFLPALATAVAQRLSLAVLSFDFSGNGGSEGVWQYCAYSQQVKDLLAAVRFMRERGFEVVGVMGHSMGGDVALLYAAEFHDVDFAINISGRAIMQRGIYERFSNEQLQELWRKGEFEWRFRQRVLTVTAASIEERMDLHVEERVKDIPKEIEVMTIHGDADEIIPLADAKTLDASILSHTLVVVEGADHFYSAHQSDMVNEIVQWMLTRVSLSKDVIDPVIAGL